MAKRISCCVCDVDMTATVHLVCEEEAVQVSNIVAGLARGDIADAVGLKTVELTCPNGHTCSYACGGE